MSPFPEHLRDATLRGGRFPLHFLARIDQAKMEVAAAYGCEPKDLQVAGYGLELRLDGRVVAVRAAYSNRWVVVGVHA